MFTVEHPLHSTKRFPSGVLFVGLDGTDFYSQIDEIILFQECLQKKETPCGECSVCVKVPLKKQVDVLLLKPDGKELSIDLMRDSMKWLMISPSEMEHKYLIIDQAEWMSLSASNSILKMLEEPPAHGRIFLCSTHPDEILKTIRSRVFLLRLQTSKSEKVFIDAAQSKIIDDAVAVFFATSVQPFKWVLECFEALAQSKELLPFFFKRVFATIVQSVSSEPMSEFQKQSKIAYLESLIASENSVINHYGNALMNVEHLYLTWRDLKS